ncbi:MAG: tripartite tricarboxylate transporter substrate binding protein [Burkholderiaceae bacterium]|nr:tripartite tricarboxylate transporter substrate binding protein [Burkholderiaceae bacterium]
MKHRHTPRRAALQALSGTFVAAVLAGATLSPGAAMGQDYPTRPVKMLVGFSAGGGVDALARMLGDRLAKPLGQNVVVENKPGASSTIAANTLMASAADGYTVLLGDSSLLIAARAMQNVSFDPVNDFVPVAGVATAPLALAVGSGSPLQSLEDMARTAKSGKPLNFATSGIGTVHHLAMEHMQALAGIELTHLPYRGASALLPDLISGTVDMGVLSAAAAMGQVKAGKIRVLGLTSPVKGTDWRAISDWLPGFDASPRLFVLAPAGTPGPVVARLESELGKLMTDPAIAEELVKQGFVPAFRSGKEVAADMSQELDRWTGLIRRSGIVLK